MFCIKFLTEKIRLSFHDKLTIGITKEIVEGKAVSITKLFHRLTFGSVSQKHFLALNQPPQKFGVLLKIAFASIALHGATDTTKSSLYMKITLPIIIEWVTLNASFFNEPFHIFVAPFKNGQANIHMVFLAPIRSANDWLIIKFCSFGAFTPANALH